MSLLDRVESFHKSAGKYADKHSSLYFFKLIRGAGFFIIELILLLAIAYGVILHESPNRMIAVLFVLVGLFAAFIVLILDYIDLERAWIERHGMSFERSIKKGAQEKLPSFNDERWF